jgi:hypothetical protein
MRGSKGVVVTTAEYLGGFRYRVSFSDGVTEEVDLWYYILRNPTFRRLGDATYLPQGRARGGALVWPGGDSITAESLYDQLLWNRQFPAT